MAENIDEKALYSTKLQNNQAITITTTRLIIPEINSRGKSAQKNYALAHISTIFADREKRHNNVLLFILIALIIGLLLSTTSMW